MLQSPVEPMSVAIWDKSVLGSGLFFFLSSLGNNIPLHSLPKVPKIIIVENQNLLLDGSVP